MFAEGLLMGKEFASKCFIYDGNSGRVLIVLSCELSPTQKRNLHRRKIILAHHLPHGDVLRRSFFLLSRQQKIIEPIVVRDQLDAPECGRTYAGEMIEPVK